MILWQTWNFNDSLPLEFTKITIIYSANKKESMRNLNLWWVIKKYFLKVFSIHLSIYTGLSQTCIYICKDAAHVFLSSRPVSHGRENSKWKHTRV